MSAVVQLEEVVGFGVVHRLGHETLIPDGVFGAPFVEFTPDAARGRVPFWDT